MGGASRVEGWVGGEHGDAAVPLWSTVKVEGVSIEDYSALMGVPLERRQVESYVKAVSKFIVDTIGGTEYGPAASFRDITKAIVRDTNETLSIAAPTKFSQISEPVFVGLPTVIGQTLGPSLYQSLTETEKSRLGEASRTIFQTYLLALEGIEKQESYSPKLEN